MFNFSDSSFGFYFDSIYDIRRDWSVQAFRGAVRNVAQSSLAVRLALAQSMAPAFDLRLEITGEQVSVSSMLLGLSDISRLAWRITLAEAQCSAAAMNMALGGALTTQACVVLRVREEERFTN